MLCGKLLVMAMPVLLRSLARYEELEPLAADEISIKDLNRRRRSSLEAHRREIPQ